ncbi:YTH domain-containing family protein 1 [Hibiscus syriacus]|uniref:YTH domain-containing family protein n=1 Tax=Hibiscus syriacus TaxID=106335 RepID=A0A6A3AKT4_HIBSY|nr:YTH domain-containing protein ECT4-like [Hibiscus syriacus]XP_039001653.1 YTH domain-containing protein ECT4-like [Hibiscus syriacus]XP_039001654.1 YTH domain-containing protein ECT4-like [Hibiscus syriacus]XP_039001655.1 YTH domain-containing protein ECT4-like [Hibiscus syriacus]KAE8703392.1 YTH domain-containing family protein 1 [Hibiscus syriacus]
MYPEEAPEFVIDQGSMYYPTATNVGYYFTGFESPVEWEEHQSIFSGDGADVQFAGAQTESLPFVYYTPSYGYEQSPYNPYNPYMSSAVMGEGPFLGAQQYYPVPPFPNPVSPTAYVPVIIQPDGIPNSSTEYLLDSRASVANRPDGRGVKHNPTSASAAFSRNYSKSTPNQADSLTRVSDGASRHSAIHGKFPDSSHPVPAHIHQGRIASGSIQSTGNSPGGKLPSHRNQLQVDLPVGNTFPNYGSTAPGRDALDKLRSNVHVGRVQNDAHGFPDTLGEQNRGPRTNRLKNEFTVKAYTTKAGNIDVEGNIVICTDQYNKDDFPIDYVDAKFFVVKSYSEDDVHKSIKYNVWSSTPNGNKKLGRAFEDAQKIAAGKPSGCPVFLFFSVNASGQFCGVAEMIGSVDFQKDMDFWQQDKWSGSFPVKWHIIKDVPNSHFRHIILENNENKPVTNSRDTQEIMYKQGMEMLKVFKNLTMKTSLLDDFMYYENRQRIMQEEKARLLTKSFENPVLAPALDVANKLNFELRLNDNEKDTKPSDPDMLKSTVPSSSQQVSSDSDMTNARTMNENIEQTSVNANNDTSTLKIGSLSINPKQDESKPSVDALVHSTNTNAVEMVTVGSMPVKVDGFTESSGFLTVGTIPLNPKTLQAGGNSSKMGSNREKTND